MHLGQLKICNKNKRSFLALKFITLKLTYASLLQAGAVQIGYTYNKISVALRLWYTYAFLRKILLRFATESGR